MLEKMKKVHVGTKGLCGDSRPRLSIERSSIAFRMRRFFAGS
jgi:hypothetical protein